MAQEIVVVLIYEAILPRPPCSEVSRVDCVAEAGSGGELRGGLGVDMVDDDLTTINKQNERKENENYETRSHSQRHH